MNSTLLNSYSICEKHYNQVISTNYFYQQLLDNSLIDYNKRRRIDTITNPSKSTFNFSIIIEETLLTDKSHLLGTFESTEDGSLIANQETQSGLFSPVPFKRVPVCIRSY